MRHAATRSRAVMLARNLSVTPSNLKNPAWMAEQASALGRAAGLRVRVWDDAELRTEGFGGILAVGRASATPPRLVQARLRAAEGQPEDAARGARRQGHHLRHRRARHQAGRGHARDEDRHVRARRSCSRCWPPAATWRSRCASPACLPWPRTPSGAASYRPGDVITQYGGRTVEIGNTDAEGRLVLADALAYADAAPRPRHPGRHRHPHRGRAGRPRAQRWPRCSPPTTLCARRSSPLVRGLGSGCGRCRWWPTTVALLDSEVADINHIAGPGGGAGSITAALFLREFVGDRRWAHLDIAGTGRSDVDRRTAEQGSHRLRCSAAADLAGGHEHERWIWTDRALVPGERRRGSRPEAAGLRGRHLDGQVHVPRRAGLQDLADARGSGSRAPTSSTRRVSTATTSSASSATDAADVPGQHDHRLGARRSSRRARSWRSPRAPRASAAARGPARLSA